MDDDKNQSWNDTEDRNKNIKYVLQANEFEIINSNEESGLVLYIPESSDDEKCKGPSYFI